MCKVFGYASITKTDVDDSGLDIESLVNERNWTLVTGVLGYAILPVPVRPDLEFGNKPDKKTLRKMVKEQKNVSTSKP